MREQNRIHSESRSILLSRALVFAFAAILLLIDLAFFLMAVTGRRQLIQPLHYLLPGERFNAFCCWLYPCSVPGYLLLWYMNRLLSNLRSGAVFTEENVKLLRRVSWCCISVVPVSLGFAIMQLPSLFILGAAAAFVGLIVRIVKNVFEQAILMKDELDFTV